MNINVGDLVIFSYQRKDSKAKVGLVLKKEIRPMPRYAGVPKTDNLGRPMPLDPLTDDVMSCYCLWTHTEHKHTYSKKWWVPIASLTLVIKGEKTDA
jgi:hypothetical protein